MRTTLIRFAFMSLSVLAIVATVRAEPIFPNTANLDVDVLSIDIWSDFSDAGGDLRARSPNGDFLLFLFARMNLSANQFCRQCEPVRTNTSNPFSTTLRDQPDRFGFVAIVDPTDNSEVRFGPPLHDITFAGEFRTTSPLFLDVLGDRRRATLAATITAIEKANGHQAFAFDLSGIGEAEVIQTESNGQFVRGVGYRFLPTPEPATLLLLGSGLAFAGVRRRNPLAQKRTRPIRRP